MLSSPACRQMPGAPQPLRPRAREGNRGTTLHPGRPAHTPTTGSSGKPLPGLPPTLRPRLLPFPRSCHPARASGRVQDRAQPGRAAAPAGRPRRGRERADNAPQRERRIGAPAHSHPSCRPLPHHISASPLTLKQRGVRYGRLWYLRCQPAAAYRTGRSGARLSVQIAPERPQRSISAMSSPSSFFPGGSSGAGHWGACMQGTKLGSLVGLSRGQHAILTAIGISHGHPAGLALADVDASCPERDETVDLLSLITVDGWSEVEM